MCEYIKEPNVKCMQPIYSVIDNTSLCCHHSIMYQYKIAKRTQEMIEKIKLEYEQTTDEDKIQHILNNMDKMNAITLFIVDVVKHITSKMI